MSNFFKLTNNTIFLSTEAPGGIYNAAQLKVIANLCDEKVAIVKATEDQRLALAVKPEMADEVSKSLQSAGLGVRHYQDGLHGPTSCIGALCPDHEQDALTSALDISEVLSSTECSSSLKIGINGCAKCCTPCHTLDVSIIGDQSGYRISLGGKNTQIPEMASFMAESVPSTELPAIIKRVVDTYNSHAQSDENLQSVIERIGASEFISVLAPYSQDAASTDDPFDSPKIEADKTVDENVEVSSEPITEPSTEETNVEGVELLELDDDIDAFENISDHGSKETIDYQHDADASGEMGEINITPIANQESAQMAEDISIKFENEEAADIMVGSDDEHSPSIRSVQTEADMALTDEQAVGSPSQNGHQATLQEATLVEVELEAASDPVQTSAEALPSDGSIDGSTEPSAINEEEAFESQINASISAQAEIIDNSEEDDARSKALEILSESSATLDDESVSDAAVVAEEDAFELISTDNGMTDAVTTDDIDQIEIAQELSMIQQLEDSETERDMKEFAEELIDTSLSKSSEAEVSPIASIPKRADNSNRSWNFSGFDIDAEGNPILHFANGVELTVSSSHISQGELTIGGKTVQLNSGTSGLELSLDGVKVFIPNAA